MVTHGLARSGTEAALLVREASGTLVVRVVGLGLSFGTAYALVHLLTPAEYGAYRYALAWLALLAVPGLLGMHRLVLRETSVYAVRADWGHLRGLVRRSNQVVLAATLVTMLAAAAVTGLLPAQDSPKLHALRLALLALPLITLAALRQAILQGLNRITLSQLPDLLIQPVLFLALAGAAVLVLPGSALSLTAVLLCYAAVLAAVFALGAAIQRRVMPLPVRDAVPRYATRAWVAAALPLLVANGITILHMQVTSLLLGTLDAAALVGIYTIASQGAQLIVFVYFAANQALAPTFARLYAQRDLVRLQQVATHSARMVFVGSLPVALPLMLFPASFMGLFGDAYRAGANALVILAGAQVFNAATGSGGWLLTMTGHERHIAGATGAAAAASIVLNLLLVPVYGLEGAAAASAAGIVVQNALATWLARRTTGIRVTALGRWW